MNTQRRFLVAPALAVFAVSVFFKLLLIPAYRSTDFEVHRHWLALTYNLKPSEWYFDETSQWSLDYPPGFAWFERAMAQLAPENALVLDNLGYESDDIVYFQRITVMISDLALWLGVALYCSTWPGETTTELKWSSEKVSMVTALVFWSPGLIYVDHIHFQYNGMLIGLLVVSLSLLRRGDVYGDLGAALVFSVLLTMKHLFVYAAPVYAVYLLRHYCFLDAFETTFPPAVAAPRVMLPPLELPPMPHSQSTSALHGMSRSVSAEPSPLRPVRRIKHVRASSDDRHYYAQQQQRYGSEDEDADHGRRGGGGAKKEFLNLHRRFSVARLALMGGIVCVVGGVALFSVVYDPSGKRTATESIKQVLSRLAPIDRGLLHAYWAPNFWAVYAFVDRVIAFALPVDENGGGESPTAGLVRPTEFSLLPNVPPLVTLLLFVISAAPALEKLYRRPHPKAFVACLIYTQLCAFLFGFHVHEKQILVPTIVCTLLSCDSAMSARLYLVLSWTAHVSLLPLLTTFDVFVLKYLLLLLHILFSLIALSAFRMAARRALRIRSKTGGFEFSTFERIYIAMLGVVAVFYEIGWFLLAALAPRLTRRFEFLPRMVVSVTCAIGVFHCWVLSFRLLKQNLSSIATYSPRFGPGAPPPPPLVSSRAPGASGITASGITKRYSLDKLN